MQSADGHLREAGQCLWVLCRPKVILKAIQRFTAHYALDGDLIARPILSLLPGQDGSVLGIDRTNWKFGQADIDILMLGVVHKGVAFPLLFTMPDKSGNSNGQERIQGSVPLVMVAFVWCYRVGIYLHQIRPTKIKKHGRMAKSIFKYGRDHIASVLLYQFFISHFM